MLDNLGNLGISTLLTKSFDFDLKPPSEKLSYDPFLSTAKVKKELVNSQILVILPKPRWLGIRFWSLSKFNK